jgi:mRNA-degrading endonuclease RelE of RelBE toxin-antitoxin system
MKVEYRTSFLRDIKKIRNISTKELIKKVIEEAKVAQNIFEIHNIEPLTARGKYFKIKHPPYRFGVYIDKGIVEFIRFGTRENFYKNFPSH